MSMNVRFKLSFDITIILKLHFWCEKVKILSLCMLEQYFVCLFDLILYVPSTIFQLNRDGSSWVDPVLS